MGIPEDQISFNPTAIEFSYLDNTRSPLYIYLFIY
jgi:hypothetical protein